MVHKGSHKLQQELGQENLKELGPTLSVTLKQSVTQLGYWGGDMLAGECCMLIPSSNKVRGSTLEQPQRAGMVHKVRLVTLGSRRCRGRQLDSERPRRPRCRAQELGILLKYYYSATAF